MPLGVGNHTRARMVTSVMVGSTKQSLTTHNGFWAISGVTTLAFRTWQKSREAGRGQGIMAVRKGGSPPGAAIERTTKHSPMNQEEA